MPAHALLKSVRIQGYRPFGDFLARLGPLEVLAGANGSGKSSLFEFLRFLRDGLDQAIPPEIVAGSIGQQVFHSPGPERFSWNIEVELRDGLQVRYRGQLMGPVGRSRVSSEIVEAVAPTAQDGTPEVLLDAGEVLARMWDPATERLPEHPNKLKSVMQLGLALASDPLLLSLYNLREYIRGWRFYGALNLALDKIRRPVPTEQDPVLREDAGNLSSVLHFLYTEHRREFDELRQLLRSVVPGFMGLKVKAYGAPGHVVAMWQEEGVEHDLTLADLSDGILHLICWATLCLQRNPPTLICIDEPDQGVHPRTLPVLAGLFDKASERTQLLLATHSSYFLTQFDVSRIAVFRKENGEAKFLKPQDSKILVQNLADFGPDEIEVMHRSDELERLA
jgi:predicted ATPase